VVACSLAALVILLALPPLCWLLGVLSLALVAGYPFMKRITWWPQAWLGLTFNWGALMGYAAQAGDLSGGAILLYISGVFWTLGYDTIYALQDLEDDALAGVKSSARKLGKMTPWAVLAFYAATVFFAHAASLEADLGPLFGLGLLVFGAHLLRQALRVPVDDPALALKLFKSNVTAGAILFFAIVAGGLPLSG
jgi:4-hydroxybenzoate polyprenyltransferase